MRAIISTYARKVPCFLFSPIKCAVSSGFPSKDFQPHRFSHSQTGIYDPHSQRSVLLNTLYNAQDTYLCSLSLHTVKNCAKITCIGLYNCGLFFIFIFLYKEVFRYESFE